jgi:regulator of sigma E protease
MEMPLRVDFIGELVEKKRGNTGLILPRVPVIVSEAPDSLAAYKAGIRNNDQVIAINEIPVKFFDEYKKQIASYKNKNVTITLLRGADTVRTNVLADKDARLGFIAINSMEEFQKAGVLTFEVKKYGFFEAIPAGIKMAGSQLKFYIDQFKKILSPETGAYKGVGGFKSMGNIFPGTWNWESFWTITAFFSIVLAFMNLLPIPALDGGHVLFTLIEMITGRKPNQKFLEYAQLVGMVLLLGLMLYANGNDWFGYGRSK